MQWLELVTSNQCCSIRDGGTLEVMVKQRTDRSSVGYAEGLNVVGMVMVMVLGQ